MAEEYKHCDRCNRDMTRIAADRSGYEEFTVFYWCGYCGCQKTVHMNKFTGPEYIEFETPTILGRGVSDLL